MNEINYGNSLRRIRNIYGYKLKDISKALEFSSSYLCDIEKNRKKPTLILLEKYSDLLEIKLSKLLSILEKISSDGINEGEVLSLLAKNRKKDKAVEL